MGYSPHEAKESFACFLKMRATTLSAKENNWRHCTSSGQKTNTETLKSESRNCVWTLFQANPRHLNCNVCSGKMFQLRLPHIYARKCRAKHWKTDSKRRQNLSFINYRGNYHGPHGFKSPSASLPYQLGGGAISARAVVVACKTSFTVSSNSSKV